jgi:hypothetical protein
LRKGRNRGGKAALWNFAEATGIKAVKVLEEAKEAEEATELAC